MKTIHHHTCNPCSLLHKLLLFIPSPRYLRVLGVSALNLSTVFRVPHSAFRISLFLLLLFLPPALLSAAPSDPYLGSKSCRSCHEKFYELWSTSYHGLAMRPYDDAFAQANLTPQDADIPIGNLRYRAHVGAGEGYLHETSTSGEKDYPIAYVLGGKNVFFFLTPLDHGRLQTLPLAYDVQKKAWYDMALSGVRHALASDDQPFPWTDPFYTFNTTCYGCHVSQLSTNYDANSDTYHTTWKEPGINCETCHGPGEEHVRTCEASSPNEPPKDLKLKVVSRTRGGTTDQVNSACAICHAKLVPITAAFIPGDDFFQHYDLMTLEDVDFYPDGRDLGENYTYTLWRMSPCAKSGQLDCLHCHTSSGRYRFSDPAKANEACLPCHEALVKDSTAHSHHKAESEGNRCVTCHMPATRFAAMQRTDHSMRAPMPASSLTFGSPNACVLCHKNKDNAWANQWAETWYGSEYQKATVNLGTWIASARKGDWSALDAILHYIQDPKRDEIVAASLVRLLRGCPHEKKGPVLTALLEKDPSPLIRARAAEALGDALSEERVAALLKAVSDPCRLVRVRVAAALAPVSPEYIEASQRGLVQKANDEFLAAMSARPDDFSSYYNLGVYYSDQGKFDKAVEAYERSVRLRPGAVLPLINAAMTYNALKKPEEAERCLRTVIDADPKNVAAQVNLGLLLGEQGRLDEAASAYQKVLALDPNDPVAAYNLGVIRGQQGHLEDAVQYCRKAWQLIPGNPDYAKTLAYYLMQSGKPDEAKQVINSLPSKNTP